MNSVERVKSICKERKIPISKLERDLGFANGYVGQLKKGAFPDDRLQLIADYLGTTTIFLMTGEEKEGGETYYLNEETREIAQEIFENKDMRTLFDMSRKMTPDRLKAHIEFMKKLQDSENE